MTPHQERLLAHDLRMPPRRAMEYHLPTGRLVREEEARGLEGPVATVGDVSSLTARRLGLSPVLSVFDGRTRMLPVPSFARAVEGEPLAVAGCPLNTLSKEMSEAVRRGLSEGPALLRADGEEDLAVLAVVLFAPDGTNVLYGCPGRGLVHAVVDDGARSDVEALVDLMRDARRGRFIYSEHAVYIRSVRLTLQKACI